MKLLLFVACIFSFSSKSDPAWDLRLHEALDHYKMAERSLTIDGAERGFNEALAAYAEVANSHCSSALLFNLGSCYFQLGQLPLAIAHYEEAHRLSPRHAKISEHLQIARQKVGISSYEVSPAQKLLLTPYISKGERLVWGVLLATLATLFLSLTIWLAMPLFKFFAITFATLSGLAFCSLIALNTLVLPQAVVVKALPLRLGGADHYAQLSDQPLRAGTVVDLVAECEGGEWVQVQSTEGRKGFLPSSALKPLFF